MYLKSGLGFLLSTYKDLFNVCKHLSGNNLWGGVKTSIDALYCLFVYGSIFTEYEALNFKERSHANRKTFVTVIWLLKQLEKYNPMEYRHIFHDKIIFNETFQDYIGRKWLSIPHCTHQQITTFIGESKRFVLKNSSGCSGKQVYVTTGKESKEGLLSLINSGKYNLIEEILENCEQIKDLNPTSLNTIRVVTIHRDNYFKVICAALRIGAKGSNVDNVSQGGTAARINVETGKIDSLFFANSYREHANSQKGRNEIGFDIPFWKETISMLEKASRLVPEIHVVGWDVAITENGPAIIEGNESFHTVIMQMYADTNSPGLKYEFSEALQHI